MSRKQLSLYGVAALCAASVISCSLDPGALEPVASESGSPSRVLSAAASPGSGDLSGAIKADEFNDLATGDETPVSGGQVVVRLNAEPDSLNYWIAGDMYSSIITSYIHSSLLRQNPETFQWEPSVAERWIEEDMVVKKDGTKLRGKVTESAGVTGPVQLQLASGETLALPRDQVEDVRRGVSFTMFLRRTARFQDGRPITAADVKFSVDTVKNEEVNAPALRTYYNDLEGCEILDPYTVRLTYAKQYWMAREFAGSLYILPKHIHDPDNLSEKDPKAFAEQFNESPLNRAPVGSGPYQFEKWDTGSQVILTRNKEYWDERHPGHLDRIIFRFISDPVAALQALKNGEVNVIPNRLTPEQYENEMSDPEFLRRFAKIEFYTGGFSYIGWNTRKPPLDDVRVRQAMAYGALNQAGS